MKKTAIVIALFAVAAAGVSLGRLSGGQSALPLNVNAAKRVIPLFPAPPKDDPAAAPAPASPPEAEPVSEVIIETPAEGAAVGTEFELAGRAPSGARSVQISISDAGSVVFSGSAAITAETDSKYGRFSRQVVIDRPLSGEAAINVTASVGVETFSAERRVVFGPTGTVRIKVFFTNSRLGGTNDCGQVFGVERTVADSGPIYRLALDELIKGPTDDEKADGYLSSLPKRTTLRSVAADGDGVVRADFTSSLESGVAGSCRVDAIRSQIETTLEQFPETRGVVLSVNGESDGVLQP